MDIDNLTMDQKLLMIKKCIFEKHPSAVLVAVSKTFPPSKIEEAYLLGQRHFGESRIQELAQKANYFWEKGYQDIIWHFIGHIQSNKMKQLLSIPQLKYIHSIDRLELLQKMAHQVLLSPHISLQFFLEINCSKEETKFGLNTYSALKNLIEWYFENPQYHTFLQLKGLMTIGPIQTRSFEKDTKQAFDILVDCKKQLMQDFPHLSLQLSMGMSSDYLWALDRQSDFIRIGSFIFGDR